MLSADGDEDTRLPTTMTVRNPPPAYTTVDRRLGLFHVRRDREELVLRLDKRGEVSIKGCVLFAATMVSILLLGVMAVMETAQAPARFHSMDDPARLFAPAQNHFGFLWLFGTVLMLFGAPLYLTHVYRSALTFTFRRADDAFLKNKQIITQMYRIEYICLRERRDPDQAYLYLIHVVYNDGMEMEIQSGYDEREMMNLANEIASFVDTRVVWR